MGNTNAKPHPKPRNKKQVRWKAAERPTPPGKPFLKPENALIPDVVHITWHKPQKDGGSPIISYLVEHRRLGSTHWVKSSTQPVNTTELAVNGLEPGWLYQFRVRAQNPVGLSDFSEISEPFTVTLQRSAVLSPKFIQTFQDTTILENDKVEFEVHFIGQPTPTICWFKDGFEIFSGNRTRITTVSDRSVLSILKTAASDEGEIKCTATNKAGHIATKAKLTIEAPPSIQLPRSYQEQDGIIFEIGEKMNFHVYVYGRPTPLIFWSHDGESVVNDERHELEYADRTATVVIENAVRTDRGEYQIRAVNKLGQDSASFLVTITDKPAPPGRARVLLTSGRTVTISWSTPEDDGGCKIGNYIIEYYRIGWNIWLKAATSRQLTTMLGDLIEGSQYKFRVKAESPYGVSDPSEESETVFIPDHKRGITEPNDVLKETSTFPLDIPVRQRRGSSSPRVSFALDEDAPIRPERKKTGKTPEASPRMKRKQIPSPLNFKDDFQASKVSPQRRLSIPGTEVMVDRRSPFNNKQETPKGSPTSPLQRQMAFNFPEFNAKQMSINDNRNETKSPSPEIIITDFEPPKSPKKSPSKSPDHSPRRKRSLSENEYKTLSQEKTISESFRGTKNTTADDGSYDQNRIRPSLTRQQFSGSSEFMLVLCPEEQQGLQLKKLGISFDENSVPPPLSLSAPELGNEPPEQITMIRSSSSSELLCYRLMERMNEEALEEEKQNNLNDSRKMGLDIPTIQLNSKPTKELAGLERKPSANRRFSSGAVMKQRSKWSPRRQSLQNTSDSNILENPLYKYEETAESRRELMELREQHKAQTFEEDKEAENDDDAWMREYEESIPSDEESDYSNDDFQKIFQSNDYNDQREEEIYNPRERMMSAIKVDNDKPFEILTVRKEPPHPNIVPKPILKKKVKDDMNANGSSRFKDLSPQRNRSGSLVDTLLNKSLTPNRDDPIYARNRSNSLLDAYDERIDVNQIKTSPTINKRRSFSLIPSQANFIKDAFKSKKKDNSSTSPPKEKQKMNVSALASSTSIAGASLVLPENMAAKKDAEEEAKVVVDFYGDIVKSFGGRSKPTAEFSRTIVPKYDTYEERKISEIKPSHEASTQEKPKAETRPIETISRTNTKPASKQLQRQDTPREDYTPPYSPTDKIDVKDAPKDSKFKIFDFFGSFYSNRESENKSPSNVVEESPMITSPPPSSKHEEKTHLPINFNDKKPLQSRFSAEKSPSRPTSITRKKKSPRSRDASTSPVRFDNWESRPSSRSSFERDYYNRESLSRGSSIARSLSPVRPKLREITTQTSFRIESKTPADVLKQREELASKAEKRMRGVFEYFTDLAMVSVACYLYLFQNEFFAIPILLTLVYRQLSEKMTEWKEKMKRRMPRWIMRKFQRENL